jgi:ATP-dependent DNA ligase
MCLLPLLIIELGATQKAARIAPSDPERRQAKPGLQLNEHITVAGDVVFRHACALGLDGIVSKKLGSRYVSGRSQDWLKFKNPTRRRSSASSRKIGGRRGGGGRHEQLVATLYRSF